MRQGGSLILGIMVSLFLAGLGLSQEIQTEPETLWLWGEVVSVDTQNKTLAVKYLDFETDQEKEMSVNVDEKTSYENIKSLDELKPEDNVSIDYILTSDGQNVAKNIVVEKSEETPPVIQEQAPEEKIEPLPGLGQ